MTIDWLHFTPWPALAGGALIGLAAALFVVASTGPAPAQQEAVERELEKYRQMMKADPWANPANLDADRGESLWKTAAGPKKASLEMCDLGKGPGKVEGAFAACALPAQAQGGVAGSDGVTRPDLAIRDVVQGGDDARGTGLGNLGQGDAVQVPEPAPAFDHVRASIAPLAPLVRSEE